MYIVNAPAKINMFLNVVRKLNDGYHEIESVFHCIGLYDRLFVKFNHKGNIKIKSNMKVLQNINTNIIVKAIEYLKNKSGYNIGARVYLKKNIPAGGGLGGGSSDAAAFIKLAMRRFNIEIKEDDYMEIGYKVGFDVPFFLSGSNMAIVRGKGEMIKGCRPVAGWAVLIFPNITIPTKDMFVRVVPSNKYMLDSNLELTIDKVKKIYYNTFERVVIKKYHLMNKLFDRIRKMGFFIGLSGSGSTLFSLFKKLADAKKFYYIIREFNVRAKIVRLLN